MRPIAWRANPDVETTDWRARRGKIAHRVRREGTASPFPTPILWPLSDDRGDCVATLFDEPTGLRTGNDSVVPGPLAISMAVPLAIMISMMLAVALTIAQHILFVIPAILHKVDRLSTGVVFAAMLAPVLCVTRRYA